jgi:O-antigen/teichoic acid export membrane protein
VLFVLVGAAAAAGAQISAAVVMAIAVAATCCAAFLQRAVLQVRTKPMTLASPSFEMRRWVAVSIPILAFSTFYLLLTNVDVILLEHLRSPEEVAVYYAASKTLALVAFVSFSVSAASARRFSEYWTAGKRDQIEILIRQSVRWTFWPSLIGAVLMVIASGPLLALFGDPFLAGQPLMVILAIGLVAQASTGPAEALLNMLHQERSCAAVYAGCFAFNLVACLLLIPSFGAMGAACAMAGALILKSVLLFAVIKTKLSLHAFICGNAVGVNRTSPSGQVAAGGRDAHI